MSAPPVPPPFEHLGNRPFSFYPSIIGIEHNDWRYGRATWSEVMVVNTKTGDELWVPRRYLGELARIEEPVMIWGLTKELEYRAGSLVPHVRRVIEMPRAVNDIPRPADPAAAEPAPVVGIRTEPSNEARIGRLVAATLLLGVTGTAIFVGVYRHFQSGKGVVYRPIFQSSLGLTAQDDYFAVTRKLGQPLEDRWRDTDGEIQYRLLRYADKFVILMGRERNAARYIGALNRNWRVVDSVELPGSVKTYAMLANLPRF
jgi:hypothetical protein